ncbi:hypothetical protein LEM8419_02987 [Neolewinella maritima]|uniref:Uncharacterized protein n=1 Tax=Neolewinella maritima TaxID=1383882 RepID=A0ABN8F9V9_9BACT|nr:hypothetical protein [Neolewinella maritima]CAH1002070.1 hypothetical protein LEM8419_02987 [Neolewinella maritima]
MTYRLFYISILALLLAACQPEDTSPIGQYRSAVAEGLEAPAAPTEAVLGIELGIPAREFFDRCTALNQQQLITMGRGGTAVDHKLDTELDRPAMMTFSPIFIGEPRTLQALELSFIYDEWSPWNKSAYADSLLPQVAQYFHHTLDTDLIELQHPRLQRLFTAVDGNRLLALWKDDESTVKGMITDLSTLTGDPLELLQ